MVGTKPRGGVRVEQMSGLAKGLAIIEAFQHRKTLTVADAARAADSSRSAARRCLLTLEAGKYVELVGREFRALPRLQKLGTVPSALERLAEVAQPLLQQARDEVHESVSLAVLDGDRSLFIARAEADHIVSTGVAIGAHLPLYCSATGRVLLSASDTKQIAKLIGGRALPARTPNTLTQVGQIVAAIQAVRRTGFAISDEEIELGMRSLAVPVADQHGAVVAALSVSSASSRTRVSDIKRKFLPVLLKASEELTKRLADHRLYH